MEDRATQTEFADTALAALAGRIRAHPGGRLAAPAPGPRDHPLWGEVVDAIAARLARGGIDELDLSGVEWGAGALEQFALGAEAGGGVAALGLDGVGLGATPRRRMMAAGRLARAARETVSLRANRIRRSDLLLLFEALQGLRAARVRLDGNLFSQAELRVALEVARRRRDIAHRALYVPDPGRPV